MDTLLNIHQIQCSSVLHSKIKAVSCNAGFGTEGFGTEHDSGNFIRIFAFALLKECLLGKKRMIHISITVRLHAVQVELALSDPVQLVRQRISFQFIKEADDILLGRSKSVEINGNKCIQADLQQLCCRHDKLNARFSGIAVLLQTRHISQTNSGFFFNLTDFDIRILTEQFTDISKTESLVKVLSFGEQFFKLC